MESLNVIAISVGLGMDAMSVCMGVGVKWHGPRQRFRMAWHMGLFQFLMPIAGWFAGQGLAQILQSAGKYLAAALVVAVGAKMLWEALKSHPGALAEGVEEKTVHHPADPTRGWSLMVLSVATSIDALVVGFSLALKGEDIFATSIVIGIVAASMALLGIIIGKRIGEKLGRHAEVVGAAILIGLGLSFVFI